MKFLKKKVMTTARSKKIGLVVIVTLYISSVVYFAIRYHEFYPLSLLVLFLIFIILHQIKIINGK